jgi:hypothetical protein
MVPLAHDRDGRNDICAMEDSGLDRFEMMMLGQKSPVWLQHKSKAVVAVGFRKGPGLRKRSSFYDFVFLRITHE